MPFSVEYQGDYTGLVTELGRLLADAKDTLEAETFVTGAGTGVIPQGIVTGGTVLATSAGSVLAVGDLYAAEDALPARWQANAVWLGSNSTKNSVARLVASADPDEPQIFAANGDLIGYRYVPASQMPTNVTGHAPLVFGDVRSAFTIVDRVGMSIELVPTSARRQPPTDRRARPVRVVARRIGCHEPGRDTRAHEPLTSVRARPENSTGDRQALGKSLGARSSPLEARAPRPLPDGERRFVVGPACVRDRGPRRARHHPTRAASCGQ